MYTSSSVPVEKTYLGEISLAHKFCIHQLCHGITLTHLGLSIDDINSKSGVVSACPLLASFSGAQFSPWCRFFSTLVHNFPPHFSAQRIEWFISLVPSMFLSSTDKTFCQTLPLKHEQRTSLIMAIINDPIETIYIFSWPKITDIMNQKEILRNGQKGEGWKVKLSSFHWPVWTNNALWRNPKLEKKSTPFVYFRQKYLKSVSLLIDIWEQV